MNRLVRSMNTSTITLNKHVHLEVNSAKYNLPGLYISGIPVHKLRHNPEYVHLPPAVLVECGSFSPITTFHLQMFDLHRDY